MSLDADDAPDRGGQLFADVWFTAPPGNDHRDGWGLRLAELAHRAQPEPWDDPTEPTGRLPVLSNYLRYTYARILEEDKFVEWTDGRGVRLGAFNTGLFTPHFESVICLVTAHRDPTQGKWVFRDWVTPSDWRIRSLVPDALRPAYYFDDPRELLYDPRLELVPNLDHILDQRFDRWPADFPTDPLQRRIMLNGAAQEAGKRVQLNWRLAVPQFYWPGGRHDGRIQLLLPLRFSSAHPADLALVVDRQDHCYAGYTILTVSMAYRNARLITHPESDWLLVPPTPFADRTELDETATPKWRRVSAGDRCPLCGEATKCAIAADNRAAVCWRVGDGGSPTHTPSGATVWQHDLPVGVAQGAGR
jgi:hypothetical protein